MRLCVCATTHVRTTQAFCPALGLCMPPPMPSIVVCTGPRRPRPRGEAPPSQEGRAVFLAAVVPSANPTTRPTAGMATHAPCACAAERCQQGTWAMALAARPPARRPLPEHVVVVLDIVVAQQLVHLRVRIMGGRWRGEGAGHSATAGFGAPYTALRPWPTVWLVTPPPPCPQVRALPWKVRTKQACMDVYLPSPPAWHGMCVRRTPNPGHKRRPSPNPPACCLPHTHTPSPKRSAALSSALSPQPTRTLPAPRPPSSPFPGPTLVLAQTS